MLDSAKIREHLEKMKITRESVGSGTFDRLEKSLHGAKTRTDFMNTINRDPEARKAMEYHKLTPETLQRNHKDLYYHLDH